MSVGDRTKHDYRLMREAGADRYLLKHETSNPDLFSRLRPGTVFEGRIKHLHWLKELGFQVGSGTMVGLPGQNVKTLADDIMLMRELKVEMAGIGPFIPHPDTPLAHAGQGNVADTLRVLAVARLALPYTHLPATTALGSIQGRPSDGAQLRGKLHNARYHALAYKKLYQIYPHKVGLDEEGVSRSIPRILGIISSSGRTVGKGYGHGRFNEQRRSLK